MKFSLQQEKALTAVSKWFKNKQSSIFRLFGYAGTGKTTIAKHFAESIDGIVQFSALTGRAVQILRSKGARNARTIHSLIYRIRRKDAILNEDTGKILISPVFSINKNSSISGVDLVIVDECSMIDESLGNDLMSFGRPVLVLGDPAQLPPVSGNGFFTLNDPDFLLTEVHRQAYDNPIIRLASSVRKGEKISYGDYGNVKIINKRILNKKMLVDADQILVGMNHTRKFYNRHLRSVKGFDPRNPIINDRLVCLRNNPSKGLMNGSLWIIKNALKNNSHPVSYCLTIEEENDGKIVEIKILEEHLQDIIFNFSYDIKMKYDDFDYGYALTVHKAQGSQWENVILFDQSFIFRDAPSRWLYTGITRASENLIIVR